MIRQGDTAACANCGQTRWITGRGLCYKCYADPAIRSAATFRGRAAVLPPEISCRHCRKRKAINGRRGLCLECHRSPLVRERYLRDAGRQKSTKPLTAAQRATIEDHYTMIRAFVYSRAKRWGVPRSDRDELLGAAMENVCRRGARLVLSGPKSNPKSFILNAAEFGMRFALKWGPFKRPNTIYLADMDTDGRQLVRPVREATA